MSTSLYLVKFESHVQPRPLVNGTLVLSPDLVLEPLERDTQSPEKIEMSSSLSGWYILQSSSEVETWEEAHSIRLRLSDFGPVYIEPDIIHPFNYSNEQDGRSCDEGDYISEWTPLPPQNAFAWYLDDDKSQLRAARLPDTSGQKIRIAHLDTGFDPTHVSQPLYLNTNLQNNFVKGESNSSAVDREIEGPLRQFGHGTGTLAILAGAKIQRSGDYDDFMGGAPFADIVPIRIASSVILFRTHAFAKAVKYALNCDCIVISMSMGGVASKLWAEVVNEAYEAGVTMITAAGNNFKGLPIRKLVYPARFERVIAACGVTYGHTPYFNWDHPIHVMQGCWGPRRAMHYAMAAYTPNVPWALFGCSQGFRHAGGGTSSATPQIAAAAALLAEKYRDSTFTQKWQRAEAIREALFKTANAKGNDFEKVGRGVLQAKDALEKPFQLPQAPAPKANVKFPLLRLLLGQKIHTLQSIEAEMYEVELSQIHEFIPILKTLLEDIDETDEEQVTTLKDMKLKEIREAIINSEIPSTHLKQAIQ